MACPGPDDCLLPDTTFCDEYNACIPNTQLCPGASTPSTQPSLQPVALPPDASPEPTGSEAPWVCKDSETWVKKNDATNTKTCSWVAARPAERCLVKDAFAVLAAEACPEACGATRGANCSVVATAVHLKSAKEFVDTVGVARAQWSTESRVGLP